MKCEICHEKDAEAAINVRRNGVEEELYVCKECARQERVRRQNKSQRTRRVTGLPPGMSMSVTEISGGGEDLDDDEKSVFDSVVSAMNGLAEIISAGSQSEEKEPAKKTPQYRILPLSRVDSRFRIGSRLHLEGLYMINEIEAVRRAMHALDYDLGGVAVDGINDVAHAYEFRYTGSAEHARRVLGSLVEQERNARVRIFRDFPRIVGDSICRALALLKNCRLISPGELYDLLSPLRLAVPEGFLDGITSDDIARLASNIDLSGSEEKLDPPERDAVDSKRADAINAMFEDVVLSEAGEARLL